MRSGSAKCAVFGKIVLVLDSGNKTKDLNTSYFGFYV
jgi:hypothetical protein